MSAPVTRCAAGKWLAIRHAILAETRQGIEFTENADHGFGGVAVTCHESGRNFGHPAFQFETSFFERIFEGLGRFKFLIAQFSVAPDFIAEMCEHRMI